MFRCAPASRRPIGRPFSIASTGLARGAQCAEDDQFITITEHAAGNFRYGAAFGVNRSDDLVYINITVFNTRTAEQKKVLFRRIADLLGENPGVRSEDVFVVIVDAPKENWSVGRGEQFA